MEPNTPNRTVPGVARWNDCVASDVSPLRVLGRYTVTASGQDHITESHD